MAGESDGADWRNLPHLREKGEQRLTPLSPMRGEGSKIYFFSSFGSGFLPTISLSSRIQILRNFTASPWN